MLVLKLINIHGYVHQAMPYGSDNTLIIYVPSQPFELAIVLESVQIN